VEGEFDSLLLAQELAGVSPVVTLGSASSKPENPILMRLWAAAPWYVATDADGAGDRSASWWPARAIRVRPPSPCKDWTEAFQYPINLSRWWTERLRGIEAPALSSWDELASSRWVPAIGDPTPGIVVDGPQSMPDLARLDSADAYAIAERLAIQWEEKSSERVCGSDK
jgi:hypothetical protein